LPLDGGISGFLHRMVKSGKSPMPPDRSAAEFCPDQRPAVAGRARHPGERSSPQGFGEWARRELLATGETARKRTSETPDELTAHGAQIARLAAHRRTNSEIGAQLFISPRTVEWRLRKVFTKLGISSRKELSAALPTP
jgi:DNA-binding CsgD family transcriptional regulator